MNINRKHLILPWYFTGFSVILVLFIFILYLSERKELRDYYKKQIEDDKYVYQQIAERVILSDNDQYMKFTSFYNRIINWYTEKPQSKKGMNKWDKADFVIMSYRYEQWLDLPHFYFVSIAKMESSFNPKAKGKRGEKGIFNQMPVDSVIGTARMALDILRTEKLWLAKKLEFTYKNSNDLYKPLNALKIQALLAWYYKRKYGNMMHWITFTHWGEHRIYYYWKFKIPLPEEFVFNEGTAKEDARNPYAYYFWWEANWNAFRHFRKDVNIDKGWIKEYIKECSKLEAEFVEGWRFVKKTKEIEKKIEEKYLIIEKELNEVKKEKLKYRKLIKQLDKEYQRLIKLMKKGKYKNIVKEIFIPAKIYFKSIVNEITKTENTIKRRILNIFNILLALVVLGFAIVGIIYTIKMVIIKRRIKKGVIV